ncbi:MAG: Hsp20/alpha crystallin family [Cyanobacteriota bacterium]|jgi:HSP20 family molecular chaperone IbpA
MPHTIWSSVWDLAAAQAQLEAISAALMPLDIAPSGRVRVPSVELQETSEQVIVTAFLPGVSDPRSVQVRASATGLTFLGQRMSGYHHPWSDSLSINHFQHSVPLPVPVQDRKMRVTYAQGAIVVTLPKRRSWLAQGLDALHKSLHKGWHWLLTKLGSQSPRPRGRR